ncbi:MAG: Holliday junction branch migration protein RuvA [Candidatus Peribacteraceae bacterium]|nr:Holliday junction branch migration protein RuvA [Candidatus Peribacteraceae bacterium]MBP9850619.1 Holliday junction branch migration protein RuvA [Candidatus Peribacteraceae bacterium]
MLYALTGTVQKLEIPHIAVDVSGVSYLASVPHPVWDSLQNGEVTTLIIYTLVREDRLDLFGFRNASDRQFFIALLNLSGIGPKLALELSSIPREMLVEAAEKEDATILSSIKGVGRKTAEKLLVDLKSMFEKHPEWASLVSTPGETRANFDGDAIAALVSLGYDQHSVLDALKKIPTKLKRTEDRVAAALRSL